MTTPNEPKKCACHCHVPDHGITEHAPGSECCEAAVIPTPEEITVYAESAEDPKPAS